MLFLLDELFTVLLSRRPITSSALFALLTAAVVGDVGLTAAVVGDVGLTAAVVGVAGGGGLAGFRVRLGGGGGGASGTRRVVLREGEGRNLR